MIYQQIRLHNNTKHLLVAKLVLIAVDRDLSTCTRGEDIGTASPEGSTWWYVDLGGTFNVYNI